MPLALYVPAAHDEGLGHCVARSFASTLALLSDAKHPAHAITRAISKDGCEVLRSYQLHTHTHTNGFVRNATNVHGDLVGAEKKQMRCVNVV